MPKPAVISYALLGFFTLITAGCKLVEYANEQMRVTPKAKLRK